MPITCHSHSSPFKTLNKCLRFNLVAAQESWSWEEGLVVRLKYLLCNGNYRFHNKAESMKILSLLPGSNLWWNAKKTKAPLAQKSLHEHFY